MSRRVRHAECCYTWTSDRSEMIQILQKSILSFKVVTTLLGHFDHLLLKGQLSAFK